MQGFAPMQARLSTRRVQMAAWCIGRAQRALAARQGLTQRRSNGVIHPRPAGCCRYRLSAATALAPRRRNPRRLPGRRDHHARHGVARPDCDALRIADVGRSRALTRALGRALAALPAAEITPLLTAADSPLPITIRAEAIGALLERPARAAAIVAALPANLAAVTLFATPAPCAIAAGEQSFSAQLQARAKAAVARCQAVVARAR